MFHVNHCQINIVVLAIALFLFHFAKVWTTYSHGFVNLWETFFHTAVAQSENFRFISHIMVHSVIASNSMFAGAIFSILFTFMYIHRLFFCHSQSSQIQFLFESFWFLFFTNGQLSKFLSHFHMTVCHKSSTIHIGFFIQSQSISSSHTSQIQSQSVSVWLGL